MRNVIRSFVIVLVAALATPLFAYDATPTGGSGTSGSPWTGWESGVNSQAANTSIHFPAGVYQQTTAIQAKSGWVIYGDGPLVTLIQAASGFNGTSVELKYSSNINTSPAVSHNVVRDLELKNGNSGATGSGILCVADGQTIIERVRITGFRFGIALVQSEQSIVRDATIQNQGKAGIWLVNGGDYNSTNADQSLSPTPSGAYTNANYFDTLYFNNSSVATTTTDSTMNARQTAIVDDGGAAHIFRNVHVNSWHQAMYSAGTATMAFIGGYVEGQPYAPFAIRNKSFFSNNSVGYNLVMTFADLFINSGGHAAFNASSPDSTLVVGGLALRDLNTNVTSGSLLVGTANCVSVRPERIANTTSGTTVFDGVPGSDEANDFRNGGNVVISGVGKGLRIAEGANARMGTVTLSGGTATVSNSTVTASTRIYLTTQTPSGTVGTPYVSARSAGTSFTITSTSGTDASTVAYLLVEP